MKKLIAPCLVLGLFAAAPVLAAEDSILTGVSQYEVTALADTEMSQIQGEALVNLVNLNVNVAVDSSVLALLGSLI